eukprot:scaffold503_cov242-Isochrysis_galbana.AAC.1
MAWIEKASLAATSVSRRMVCVCVCVCRAWMAGLELGAACGVRNYTKATGGRRRAAKPLRGILNPLIPLDQSGGRACPVAVAHRAEGRQKVAWEVAPAGHATACSRAPLQLHRGVAAAGAGHRATIEQMVGRGLRTSVPDARRVQPAGVELLHVQCADRGRRLDACDPDVAPQLLNLARGGG